MAGRAVLRMTGAATRVRVNRLLLLLLLLVTGVSCTVLYVEELTAPQPALFGETAQLTCRWTVAPGAKHGSGFSQVKWSKDGHQLYKINSNGEQTDYRLPGIHVVLKESNANVVVLRDVGRASEGQYGCEVMGEGPTFRTTNATVNLTVAEVPETPVLRGARRVYRTGDLLNVSCTAERARPPAKITFLVNNRVVQPNSGHITTLPPQLEPGGAYTSQAFLTLTVAQSHEPMLRLTCRARVLGISVEESVGLRVERAAHTLFSIFGTGCSSARSSSFALMLVLPLLHYLVALRTTS